MKNIKKITLLFSLAAKICPSYMFLVVLNAIILGLQMFTNIILPKYLIDELLGNKSIEMVILWTALIVFTNLLFAFLANLMKNILEIKNDYLSKKMTLVMSEKIMRIEYKCLEDPYYLDLKERALFIMDIGTMDVLFDKFVSIIKNFIVLIGLFTIMFMLGWEIVAILIITVAIMLISQAIYSKKQRLFNDNVIPVNRKYGYYVGLSYDDIGQKDYRLYGMGKMISQKVTKYNYDIYEWLNKVEKTEGFYMGIISIVNDLQRAIASGYIGLRVITDLFGKRISLGSFSMYVSSAINFAITAKEIGNNIIDINQKLNQLDPFMEFMQLRDEKDVGSKLINGNINNIRFENVNFKYPKCENYVLKDFSFEIKEGEKISIVGLNGAGKTTIVKLLCRLYEPQSGTIYINNLNINEYDSESLRKEIAAVFQDFTLFALPIRENITTKSKQTSDDEALTKIIEQVGLTKKLEQLPYGTETYLFKNYDDEAVDMSGGEKQKVAIARALYKNSSLIILDEPTSALDPFAEAEIYENFNQLVGDKIAIYISHRMSSSVFCDKILVMNDGVITDFDSHANLMKKNDSLYCKLFNSQADNYSE
ncbi:MAG: ABC transporter ATP-binding protein [Clostridia bacterium]